MLCQDCLQVRAVHPRWRGEHWSGTTDGNNQPGSSPLARGTRCTQQQPRQHRRFIPAGAGNTILEGSFQPANPVHPRWRGEHAEKLPQLPGQGGSSPLARGTHREAGSRFRFLWFIPAGAGNTRLDQFGEVLKPVHPRWRGEHRTQPRRRAWRSGSSPLARGTRVLQLSLVVGRRFIPAGAGNTWVAVGA